MTTTNKQIALIHAIVPRAARIPSDLALLNAVSPMALTAAALGPTVAARWARAGRVDAIRNMIADALHTAAPTA